MQCAELQHGHLPCTLRARRPSGRARRAGVVLTCGKDNLLKLVDPRTFQARRPPGHRRPVLMLAMRASLAALPLGWEGRPCPLAARAPTGRSWRSAEPACRSHCPA